MGAPPILFFPLPKISPTGAHAGAAAKRSFARGRSSTCPVETPIYHYDRYGHWLVCRRDCCKDNPFFNAQTIKKGGEEGQVEGQAEDQKIYNGAVTPNGMEAHSYNENTTPDGSTVSTAVNKKYVMSDKCTVCGWVKGYEYSEPAAEAANEDSEQTAEQKETARRKAIDDSKVVTITKEKFAKYFKTSEDAPLSDDEDKTIWNLQDGECMIGEGMTSSAEWAKDSMGQVVDLTVTLRVTDWSKPEEAAANSEEEGTTPDYHKDFKIVAVRKQTFAQVKGTGKTLIIPWYLRHIGDSALQNWSGLKNVFFETAPDTEEGQKAELYIHSTAFNGCTNLKSLVFPAHLKGIEEAKNSDNGYYFLNNCTSLQEIVFNSKVMKFSDSDGIKKSSYGIKLYCAKEIYICLTRDEMRDQKLDESGEVELDENGNPVLVDVATSGVESDMLVHYFDQITESEITWRTRQWDGAKNRWVDYIPEEDGE